MSKALVTCQRLKVFWSKTNVDMSWKVLVYNAIILAQLTYGLNTLNLTPGLKSRLNSFHMRGLRYMVGIDHSYYSRETNESVMIKANLLLNKLAGDAMTWHQFKVDKVAQNKDYKLA